MNKRSSLVVISVPVFLLIFSVFFIAWNLRCFIFTDEISGVHVRAFSCIEIFSLITIWFRLRIAFLLFQWGRLVTDEIMSHGYFLQKLPDRRWTLSPILLILGRLWQAIRLKSWPVFLFFCEQLVNYWKARCPSWSPASDNWDGSRTFPSLSLGFLWPTWIFPLVFR